jgi:demethylmenaquinone methyltransferase/2-methoxy-6-polyprenyl-1,4-benzoquinol methylase
MCDNEMTSGENMSSDEISGVTRSRLEAKASYNKLSRWYDLFARFESKYKEAGLQKLDTKKGEKVLEVGFGTGHCILDLARAVGEGGKVYGIDISEGMCNIAQSKAKEASLSQMVSLQCADGTHLPFEANSFDAVFMSFALEVFDTPEIPIVLNECRRVLQDGGRICVVAMSKGKRATMMLRLYEWFHERLPNYVDCRPIYAQKALEQAGFRINDVAHASMWGLPVEIVLARK